MTELEFYQENIGKEFMFRDMSNASIKYKVKLLGYDPRGGFSPRPSLIVENLSDTGYKFKICNMELSDNLVGKFDKRRKKYLYARLEFLSPID